MSNDDLVLGLTVFIVVLMLIEGLRVSLAMLDDAMPPSARLCDAGAPGVIRGQGRLAPARLLRQWLARLPFAGSVGKILARAGAGARGVHLLLPKLSPVGLPALMALYCRRRRLARMEAQLPAALDLLCDALRSGHGLSPALRLVADHSEAPLADEFRILVDEVACGASVADSLRRMALRNPGGDVGCLAVAVLVQRDAGGNLAELLAGIAALMRERRALRSRICGHAAQASLPAWMLGLLLFMLAVGLHLAHPQFVSLLWSDGTGRLVLACA